MVIYYDIFKNNFKNILEEHIYYKDIIYKLKNYNNNVLLYSVIGYPLDLLIDEIIKLKFNINIIYKNECIWNKNVVYIENQNFFEIDLSNPNLSKNYSLITELILHIIKSKNIINKKHFIIIKNIDLLDNYFFAFRILLEKYSNNVYFLCTTYKISKIENPIKSRFILYRIPLFKNEEIINIFEKLNIKLNKYLIENKSRNIINCLFISQIEENEPHLLNYEFCNYNYPPLYNYIKNKKYTLEDIRILSYKCCQYNISILDLTLDLLLNCNNNKKKILLIKNASKIDNLLCLTNKGREPIYIENLLCHFLL